MKIKYLILIILIGYKSFAQIAVGTALPPHPHSQMEVIASNKGILIPRVALISIEQSDPFDHSTNAIPESLLVYNINENESVNPGYYYWSNNKWNKIIISGKETLTSLKLTTDTITDRYGYGYQKHVFNYFDENKKENNVSFKQNIIPTASFMLHCDKISYKGSYSAGVPLEQSEYLSIPVTINKTGHYTIVGKTENGFYFEKSGYFPIEGNFTVNLQGYGIPTDGKETEIIFYINGIHETNNSNTIIETSCRPNIEILAQADFSLICNTAVVNGEYLKGVLLSEKETISIDVSVKKSGSYQIKTATDLDNGYSFSADGTFNEPGIYSVLLTGKGIPKEAIESTFTITNTLKDQNCSVTIEIPSAVFEITECNSIKASGEYTKDVPLSDTNTLEMQINVISPGAYTIKANSDNGYSFEYRGTLTQTGTTTIKLLPTPESIPLVAQTDIITITADQTLLSCKTQITVAPSLENIKEYNNLNVVYFLPSDIEKPLEEYKQRLSTLLFFMQNWYQKEMESHGFGSKTFGLLKDQTNKKYAKIMIVRGKEGKENYRYSGGGAKAIKEIDEYYRNNPSEKGSEHTLVFMASLTGDGMGNNEGGVPFYGIGKYAFVLDYRYFDVSFFPKETDTAKIGWTAGTIHELGHGLNLTHDEQKASDTFFSLMSNHRVFETDHEKSHITFAAACILNNSEVFNTGKEYYKLNPNLNIKKMRIYSDNEKIYFSAKFSAAVQPNSVVIYNDPKTSPTDGNYNAVTWATRDIQKSGDFYTVTMEMLTSEIEKYKQYPFEMRIQFCFENGETSTISHSYQFENGKATIDEEVIDFEKIPTNNWTIKFSSASTPDAAAKLFDNDLNTIWHSKWREGTDPMPYFITTDAGKLTPLEGIVFISRQDRSDGRPKRVTVEVSADGISWDNALNLELKDVKTPQTYRFNTILNTRFTCITIHDIYTGSIINPEYAHLAELQFF